MCVCVCVCVCVCECLARKTHGLQNKSLKRPTNYQLPNESLKRLKWPPNESLQRSKKCQLPNESVEKPSKPGRLRPGQIVGSFVVNQVLITRLVQWLGWVFELQQRKEKLQKTWIEHAKMRYQFFQILGWISVSREKTRNVLGLMCDKVQETIKNRQRKKLRLPQVVELSEYQTFCFTHSETQEKWYIVQCQKRCYWNIYVTALDDIFFLAHGFELKGSYVCVV